ncbi:MAG: hypothetical protein ACAI38_25205 [Myxococcota bacterium]
MPPRREPPKVGTAASDKPVVPVVAKPDQEEQPAAAPDTREPAEVARAQALAATLTGQCVRDVNGVTVLTPPRRGERPAETPRIANTAGACSSLAPVIAGISAAQDEPLSPADAGAITALERVGQSHVTPESQRLFLQSNTRTAVIVPGDYNQAVEVVKRTVGDSRERLLRQYPALATLHERFFRDLAREYGDRPMDVAAMSRAADELMAREILRLNGVTAANNVPGERSIAYPNSQARLAMVPAIIDRIAENPALVPPEVATWIRKNTATLTDSVNAIRDVNRAVRGALLTTMQATEITNLIATGQLPANLTPQEYVAALQRMQTGAVNQLVTANAYPAADRARAIQSMRAAIQRLRTDPPPVPHADYRQIGREAIQRTLEGRANATFYNEHTRRVEAVTPHNYTLALQERRVDAGSSNLSSEGVSTGVGVATVTDATRRRARGEDAIGRSAVALQTAEIVRTSALRQDREEQIATERESTNRATSRRNLGDVGDGTLAALGARAENMTG